MSSTGSATFESVAQEKGKLSKFYQLVLLTIAAGVLYPILYLRQNYQTTMLQVFHITNTQLGYLYSTLGLVFFACYLPSGWIADRVSTKWLIVFSLLATGVLGLFYARLPSFHYLILIYAAWGITTGLTFWSALLKRVNALASDDEQGRFFGILDGGRGIVEALMATIALYLFYHVTHDLGQSLAAGLQKIISFYAYVCLAVGGGLLLLGDESQENTQAKGDNLLKQQLLFLIKIPEVWLVALIVVCGYQVFWATYSFSAYLQEGGLGVSAVTAGFVTTMKLWTRPIGGIGAGMLGDRYSNLAVLLSGFMLTFVAIVSLIVLPIFHLTHALMVVVIFIGLLTYAIRGVYWAILSYCDIPLPITGLAIGLISVIGYTPDVFLPLINGYITATWPGILGKQVYFAYISGMALLGFMFTLMLKRRVTRNEQ